MVTFQRDEMDLLFRALAHGARRRILDLLKEEPGLCVHEVARHFDVSRIAVMKHLAVLSEANLVTSERVGRERRLYLNPVPIRRVHDRWLGGFAAYWADQALAVKRRVEAAERARA